jgi:ribonuclease HI
MSKSNKKFYVVWEGRQQGVFESWDECRRQIEGYPTAKFKSFSTREAAEKASKGKAQDYYKKPGEAPVVIEVPIKGKPRPTLGLCVDAACSGNPGLLEYRGVDMATGKMVFHRGPYEQGTNNIGEFLGIVTGLVWLHQAQSNLPLYSDSANAILWVRQKKARTKLEKTKANELLFEIITKAEDWLHQNQPKTKILKWETAIWGEIPADFGRK